MWAAQEREMKIKLEKKLFTRFSAVSERVTHVKTIRRSFHLKHTNMRDFPLFSRIARPSDKTFVRTFHLNSNLCFVLFIKSPQPSQHMHFSSFTSWKLICSGGRRRISLSILSTFFTWSHESFIAHIANEEVVHRRKNSPMEKFKHKKISFLFTVSMNCWYLSDSAAGKLAWCWEKAKHNSLLFFYMAFGDSELGDRESSLFTHSISSIA